LLKIEFYSDFGAEFNSPQMLDFRELYFANGWTPEEEWVRHTLEATAPEGAVEARLAIVFQQPGHATGSVHIDKVSFTAQPQSAAATGSGSGTDSGGRSVQADPESSPSILAGKPGASLRNTYENIAIAVVLLTCLYGVLRLLLRFTLRNNSTTPIEK
jgi:hypothetical protein